MFAAIYTFKIKPNHDETFKNSWKSLTELIYEYEGSYGSRLHKANENLYIAYALWPDKATWKNAGKNLPEKANEHKSTMKNSCTDITTNYELDVEEDLLKETTFK